MSSTMAPFGDARAEENNVVNTILALSRQFIYRQKFTSKSLDEIPFINYMKSELKLLYNVHVLKEKSVELIDLWADIFTHFEVEIKTGSSGEIMLLW